MEAARARATREQPVARAARTDGRRPPLCLAKAKRIAPFTARCSRGSMPTELLITRLGLADPTDPAGFSFGDRPARPSCSHSRQVGETKVVVNRPASPRRTTSRLASHR